MLVMLLGVTNAWAEEEVYKTALFGESYNSKAVSSYENSWSATNDGFTVDLTNFNNNNNAWSYVKCGRKNYESVGVITTAEAVDKAITKVVVTVDAFTSGKVNSFKLYVASDENFSTGVQTISHSIATGANTFTVTTPAENQFYKIEIDCASASSNGIVQISKIEYYYDNSSAGDNREPAGLSYSADVYTAIIGESNTFPALNNPNSLSVTYTSSEESVATVNSSGIISLLTAGETVVSATFAGNDLYKEGSASYTLTVVDPNVPGQSAQTPYTVTQALGVVDGLEDNGYSGDMYVKGIISGIKSLDVSQWQRAQYYISDDGSEDDQLLVYNGYYLDNVPFTDNNQIRVGDEVIVFGKLQKFVRNSEVTPEVAQNNYIVSIIRDETKQEAGLAYGTTEYTINKGESFTAPDLTNPNNLTVTYTSSNEDVAKVDASTGAVTIEGAGTVTITASFAGNDTFFAGEASYTLTVVDPNSGDFTWDLSTASYDANPTEDLITWSCEFATMSNAKGTSSTAVNNYIPTTRTSTRMYNGNQLTIAPVLGYVITKVVFVATTNSYATALANSTWTNATASLSGSTVTVTPADASEPMVATIGGTCGFTAVTVTYEADSDTRTPVTLTYSDESITANLGQSFDAPTLTVDPVAAASVVTYESSNSNVASVDASGSVTINSVGSTTITASIKDNETYKDATASYTLTVVDPNGSGTEDNPYTVEQAIAAIDAGTGTEGVYVTGIVSKIVTAYDSQFGNISYNISADGTTSGQQLQAYRGFSYNGEWFTSADDIKVGDEVVVYGNLTKYNTTYEFAQGNQLVSLVRTDNREPAGLSYDVANFTATIGEANEFPVLRNPNDLTVTYSSTNEAVATVDNTSGEITLKTAGQTTIKAAFAGDDAYEPGEASYLLVVKEQEVAGTDKFELVTDASSLADGDVIILAYINGEGDAWALSTTQNTNNRAANSVEIEEDGTIIPGSSIQQITLEEGFYFNVGDGYLYAASAGSNWLRTEEEADDNAKAVISLGENGDATIVFQGANTRNHLRFNANNGNPMFSCYAESSTVVTLPRIYRKVASSETPKGDVNGDGQVSIADVTALVNIILGKATPESNPEYNFDAANVNDDDDISIADVTALVNIILGKE